MASDERFKEYITELLSESGGITARPMMGEYLLYKNGVLFGGIYDDRLLFKSVPANEKYGMIQAVPYPGAKPMLTPKDADDRETLLSIVADTYEYLSRKNVKETGGQGAETRFSGKSGRNVEKE